MSFCEALSFVRDACHNPLSSATMSSSVEHFLSDVNGLIFWAELNVANYKFNGCRVLKNIDIIQCNEKKS